MHCGSTHHIDGFGVEGTPNSKTAASLGFCTCFAIVPVTAAVFHFAYFTSTRTHVQCSRANRTPPLLVCESHDVHSKAGSFPISWFSHVLGHCDGWFLHVLGHCSGQRSCVSCTYVTLYRAGRAKPTIKDRPKDQSDQSVYRTDPLEIWDRPAERSEFKKLDAAGRFESFFSLSLERERSAGEMARRCRYAAPSVLDRHQKFCESAARLGGYVEFKWRSNGERATDRARIKALWTH